MRARCWVVLIAIGLGTNSLRAGEPVIRSLNVRGLQVGGTTTLVLDGDDFGTAPKLLLPFPARQELKKGATPKKATFDVTLADDVVPGYYQLRVVTAGGVSTPAVIAVDRLAQRPLTTSTGQLPIALHGTVSGAATAETQFKGKAGQKVMIEIEAQRLGSKLRPVVHLYNAKRLQLAWSWATPTLHGDTRLEATLPEDGTYTATVHDTEYAAAAPGFFRLRIGHWSFVDRVFPPVVAKGKPQAVELLGPEKAARLDLPAAPTADVLPLAWPGDGLWSGPRPFVRVSTRAEILEQPSGGKWQELPSGAVGVSGRLLTANEEDRYRVPVTPGSKVRLEVVAERHGSPLDVALVVRNEASAQLARAEDSPGTLDPVLEYTVPARVNAIVVGVLDAQGRGGPRGVYRLTIDPQDATTARADFRLITPEPSIALPVGGRAVVPVFLQRRGYTGSVELSAAGLPAGVKLEGNTIPEGADGTLVTVSRGEASGGAVLAHLHGRAADGTERPVVLTDSPVERLQPWLAAELALALTAAKAADFQLDWRDLPADAGLVPGKKLALPVKIVTRPTDKSVVRLTLLTSQSVPVLNGKPNPNQVLRLEKATELPAKANTGEVPILVPPQLPASAYDVTVQAELLAPDKKAVLAVAYAPVRRFEVRVPLVVQLDGPTRLEAALNAKTGATLKLKGQVERREGLATDVTITLIGLPAGARANPVTVKAGATAFTVDVVLPPNLPAGEIKGMKLQATAPVNPKQPNVRVRSRDVELTLVVRAAK